MNGLRFFGIIGFALLFFTSSGYSQVRFQSGVDFTLGFPQGEFKENVDRIGLGGSGYFVYKLPKSPLALGVCVGVLIYGSDTREEPFSTEIPEVYVDVSTRNYILMCHFLFRVQPSEGKLRPYLDGLIGFNYLWTETGIYDQGSVFDDIARSVNFSDLALSYGAGGGLMIPVFEKKENKSQRPFGIFIDVGIRYLKGGNAEYLKEGSIRRENGEVEYDVSESITDFITARIGVSFTF